MAAARVEFTVEPFEAGAPGPHVAAALDAARRTGQPVEVGPFGSTVVLSDVDAAALVYDVVVAALAHGATRISLQVEREGA
jgi:hypothetical protein